MRMATARTKRLHMLLSDEEHDMLSQLAAADGLTVSDWLRLTLRRAHEKRIASQRAWGLQRLAEQEAAAKASKKKK